MAPQDVFDLLVYTTRANRQKIVRMLSGNFKYFYDLRELLKASCSKEASDQTEGYFGIVTTNSN